MKTEDGKRNQKNGTTPQESPKVALGEAAPSSVFRLPPSSFPSSFGGELRFDETSRSIYSVDASLFEVEPIGIVLPKTKEDLILAVQIAKEHGVSVVARGAATGITGGCLGSGLVIDTSKYLTRIIEINYEKEYAICEPGVVQDQLNAALASKGYRLGPDTSTGNRATLGGMVANNSSGAHSLRFGKMSDHVQEVEVLLANGDLIRFGSLSASEWQKKCALPTFEGQLYTRLSTLINTYREDIREHFPKIHRRASGFNLDELIKPWPLNLAQLISGSEGTLGIITEIKVKISKQPKATGLSVLHFHDMLEGLKWTTFLLKFHPYALEMIDHQIIKLGRISPSMLHRLKWLKGSPQMLLAVEFDGATQEEVLDKLTAFELEVKKHDIGYKHVRLIHPEEMANVWALRKSGVGLLMSRRTPSKAIAFIEDVTVPPESLAPFIKELKDILHGVNKEAGIYGHAGDGCIHVRPFINLRKKEEFDLMHQLMHEVSDLVLRYGGTLTGEHGNGLIRSWLNPKMFGPKIYRAFCEVKQIFDPENRMNPGKIVTDKEPWDDLRVGPSTPSIDIPTFLDFSKEGGFTFAAEMCNGNGMCRKKETLMCPSFHAYGDEFHTTRARAQALRAVVTGRRPLEEFTGKGLHEVMDYCLECKGCKTECPSQVDMAKMKSEFLYHYQEKHGYSLRSKLFAYIGTVNRIGSLLAPLSNWLGKTPLAKLTLNALGIAPQRHLPPFAVQRFSSWFKRHRKLESAKKVVLFNDTYNEFNAPHIGKAAVRVLERLGYEVIVPPLSCCGRPLISKGFLPQAQKKAQALVDLLFPYASQGISIVGLEPSCILTIKDDLESLVKSNEASTVSGASLTIDQFLDSLINEGELPLPLRQDPLTVLLHGHCHQKALVSTHPILNVLRAVPGISVTEIASGCCGLAGSFGYEKEHYEMSVKIGENTLFPTVRSASKDVFIVANGISCRSQIAHGTERHAKHLVELLAERLV